MISIICSIGKNNELGKNNDLIWHLKEDMKYFKNVTMNHTVIMGRKTYESIPNGLPGRKIIVITSSKIEGVETTNDLEKIRDMYIDSDEEVFVIGGSSVYNYFIPYASKLYITEINDSKDADTFFPVFDKSMYIKKVIASYSNPIEFTINVYEKQN